MSDQDELGDDTDTKKDLEKQEHLASLAAYGMASESVKSDPAKESKPNKTHKGNQGDKGKPTPTRREGSGAPSAASSAPPAPEPKDGDTPRAKALQAAARASAGKIRQRIGQTIKCPGCEVVAYAKDLVYDKPEGDPTRKAVARWIRCENEDCAYKKNTGRPWRRKVSLEKTILNQEEDLGVMSARQMDYLPKGD